MAYVDGYVIAVPEEKKQAYLELAKKFAPIFKEYGATRVVENWGDDVPEGKVTDFRRAVNAQPGESIVFSWVVYPSKEVRDRAHKTMYSDERMKGSEMPFDGKRMIIGGFTTLLDE